jgi:serine/threonine-protein kinase
MVEASKLPVVISGRYAPVRLIAQGGMGAVYEVEHARTGERLALKVLLASRGSSANALERFKKEARAWARIKSEHVVRVIDADVAPELDGAPFLVMELLEGTDLERAAAAARPAPDTVVDWLRQVARAIDKAHGLGIVHRDLKPENLFLTTVEGRAPIVKVLDFGIVKMPEDATGATGSGQVLGTPRYMAPEQVIAGARITAAADRFALGLVAYRLLAGESYFRGDALGVLAQLLHEPLRVPSERHPELGRAFDGWFARACHRSPEQRFASTAEQVEALAAALGMATEALPAGRGPSQPVEAGPRKRRRALIGVAVACAAIAFAAALGLRPKATSPGPALVSSARAPPEAPPPREPASPAPAPPALPALAGAPLPAEPRPSAPKRRLPVSRRTAQHAQATARTSGRAYDPYADQK